MDGAHQRESISLSSMHAATGLTSISSPSILKETAFVTFTRDFSCKIDLWRKISPRWRQEGWISLWNAASLLYKSPANVIGWSLWELPSDDTSCKNSSRRYHARILLSTYTRDNSTSIIGPSTLRVHLVLAYYDAAEWLSVLNGKSKSIFHEINLLIINSLMFMPVFTQFRDIISNTQCRWIKVENLIKAKNVIINKRSTE